MLGVSLPLLNILGGEGYAVLLRQGGFGDVRVHRTPDRPAGFVLGLTVPVRSAAAFEPGGTTDAAAARLAQSLGALLASCHSDGHLLGAQLVVLDARTGAPLAELAVGHTSWHAPHAVRADTRFNMAEVSKLFVALAVLRLVQRGAISLADHVAAGGVTLEHVLAHTAGHLETLYPAVTSFEQMCDLEHMAALAAAAPPLLPPGVRPASPPRLQPHVSSVQPHVYERRRRHASSLQPHVLPGAPAVPPRLLRLAVRARVHPRGQQHAAGVGRPGRGRARRRRAAPPLVVRARSGGGRRRRRRWG